MFGVQICAEGRVADLPSLRLQQVPVLPTAALTQLRVSMAPAVDKPTAVQFTGLVTPKSEKGNLPKKNDSSLNFSSGIHTGNYYALIL